MSRDDWRRSWWCGLPGLMAALPSIAQQAVVLSSLEQRDDDQALGLSAQWFPAVLGNDSHVPSVVMLHGCAACGPRANAASTDSSGTWSPF